MGAAWLERTDDVQSKDMWEHAKESPGNALTTIILKLWEEQGPRTVILGNITFPAAKQGATPE